MSQQNPLEPWVDRCSEAAGAVASALFASQAAWITIAVIFRYLLRNPIAFTEELTRFFLVWGAMLGMALALQHGRHIRVTTIFGKFPPKVQKYLDFFTDLLSMAVLGVFVYQGYKLSIFSKTLGEVSQGGLEYPIWWSQVALPIGGGLFVLQYLAQAVDNFLGIMKGDYRVAHIKGH
jgi:TRAP-type C4-dicarboxylate transport system permease small subunit